MDRKLVFAAMCMVLTLGMTWTIFVGLPMASAKSDQACQNAIEREGKFDSRTEPDSDHPANEQGVPRSHEGVINSMGDCPDSP